jgi:hypothetical protein
LSSGAQKYIVFIAHLFICSIKTKTKEHAMQSEAVMKKLIKKDLTARRATLQLEMAMWQELMDNTGNKWDRQEFEIEKQRALLQFLDVKRDLQNLSVPRRRR